MFYVRSEGRRGVWLDYTQKKKGRGGVCERDEGEKGLLVWILMFYFDGDCGEGKEGRSC